MQAIGFTNRSKQLAGATLGVLALAGTFACNTAPQAPQATTALAQQPQINQAGAQVMVNCEPHQRAVVRPTVVNGVAMSQVDCVAAAPAVAAPVAQPIAYTQPVAYREPVTRVVPVSNDLGDAQIVPVSTRTVQPVRTNQVVYDERPVRKTRTVAKSAIIIGSSAGAGAGVGAAIGGKKGALIGAAIGGGGAALWDQVTRRK